MKKIVFSFYFLFLTAALAFSQYGLIYGDLLQNPGWGSRPAGMGRAYTAVACPAGLNIYNPAGSADLLRFYSVASLKYRSSGIALENPAANASTGYELQHTGQLGITLLGFASPLRLGKTKVVAGIYLRNLADLKTGYVWRKQKETSDRTPETEINRRGALYGLTALVACSPLQQLKFGIGLTLLGGRQQIDTTYVEKSTSGRSVSQTEWKNRFSGMFIELGSLWEISSRLAWGQKLVIPYQLSLNELSFASSLSQKNYQDKVQLDMPLTFGTGLSWQPQAQLLINADYYLRPWNRLQAKWGKQSLPVDFSNAHSYHFGVEYRLAGNKNFIPLRLGFFTSPKQLYEYNESSPHLRGDQVTAKVITAGFGFHTNSIQMDMSLEAESFSFPSDWYLISELPLMIAQRNYHFSLTLIYLL